MPAGMQLYGASGSNGGKRDREGSPETKNYEHGGRGRGHDFSNNNYTD